MDWETELWKEISEHPSNIATTQSKAAENKIMPAEVAEGQV
jgi:hypothetical protein